MPQRAPRRREETQKKEKRDEGRRKFSAAPPDNHQIFIGNLPSDITEADIKEIFKGEFPFLHKPILILKQEIVTYFSSFNHSSLT